MKEKKKTIIGSLSSSLYTHLRYRRRIFFLFSFRTNVDLSLIIHVTRTPDTRKRSWGICFRCMAACRYILFTVYSPLPSVPPHRLIYGFPSRYSSPSCSSRALRLFLRVYPDFARASFTLFRPRREKVNQFTHFSYPSAIDLLFLLWGSEISRRDKFGVGRFIFVQSKVAFLSSWHKFRLSPTFFFFHANEE